MKIPKRLLGVGLLVLVAAATSVVALADPALKPKNCEAYVGDVWCKQRRGYEGGGNLFCYYSLCEAVAAGAYSCRPAESPCEPR